MKKGKGSADAAAPMGGDAASDTDCYDVFLSFGELNVRYLFSPINAGDIFVESLHRRLVAGGIRVFRDNGEFRIGEEIDQEILRAIDGAKICIPIFSKSYADSPRCLRVLAAMVDSKAKSGGGKTIIPIFYDVAPRDVRLETPLYRRTLSMLERRYGSKEASAWEDALKRVGSLRGWVTGSRSSADDIGKLAGAITVQLKANRVHVLKKDEAKERGGIDKQVEDMMDLLDLEVSDVRIVGIWGKGGVGKTTLAKVIYEQISSRFDSCSFLADIGAIVKQLGGVRRLQSKLMSDILSREYEVDQVAKGIDFFKGILRNMKVLVVLDDVEVRSHLHEIVGEKLDWFGDGSRIIVTTSIKSVLPEFISRGFVHDFAINVMKNDQALELFRKHALPRNLPIPDFDEFITGIINSVNGIPLLIEVLGWVTSLVNLEILELCLSRITMLPENFSALQLRKLVLHYANLHDLRELPSSLSTLCPRYCTIRVPQFSKVRGLSELQLIHCDLAKIDGLEDLKLLQLLKISHCSVQTLDGLESVPRLRKLTSFNCSSLTELPDPTKCNFKIDMCDF